MVKLLDANLLIALAWPVHVHATGLAGAPPETLRRFRFVLTSGVPEGQVDRESNRAVNKRDFKKNQTDA